MKPTLRRAAGTVERWGGSSIQGRSDMGVYNGVNKYIYIERDAHRNSRWKNPGVR